MKVTVTQGKCVLEQTNRITFGCNKKLQSSSLFISYQNPKCNGFNFLGHFSQGGMLIKCCRTASQGRGSQRVQRVLLCLSNRFFLSPRGIHLTSSKQTKKWILHTYSTPTHINTYISPLTLNGSAERLKEQVCYWIITGLTSQVTRKIIAGKVNEQEQCTMFIFPLIQKHIKKLFKAGKKKIMPLSLVCFKT